jgi:hypothetical protein
MTRCGCSINRSNSTQILLRPTACPRGVTHCETGMAGGGPRQGDCRNCSAGSTGGGAGQGRRGRAQHGWVRPGAGGGRGRRWSGLHRASSYPQSESGRGMARERLGLYLGNPEVAIECAMHAICLSPFGPFTIFAYIAIGAGHMFAGRYDEATSWAQKGLLQRPNSAGAARWLRPAMPSLASSIRCTRP